VGEDAAVRAGALRALSATIKSCTEQNDCIARLLSRITRGKSQTGIIADPAYACHVSALCRSPVSIYMAKLYTLSYT